MARPPQPPISDDDKKAIVEAVIEGLARSNKHEAHEQLRSMFRLETALAQAKEELARSQAQVVSLTEYANNLLTFLRPSSPSMLQTPLPPAPPTYYQMPTYPGSTVTAPVPPPATTTITVPAEYEVYQYPLPTPTIPTQNGHPTE